MTGDFDLVLVSVRCAGGSRSVSTPFVEVRETGVVGCICGAVTRAIYEQPNARTPFSREGWSSSEGIFDQLNNGTTNQSERLGNAGTVRNRSTRHRTVIAVQQLRLMMTVTE